MYISCTKCNTKFLVSVNKISDKLEKVKCSKCSHVWRYNFRNHLQKNIKNFHNPNHQDGITIAPKLAIKKSPPKKESHNVNLPAILPSKSPYSFAIPVLMIGLIIFVFTMIFSDKLETASILQNNMVINDLQIVRHKDIDKVTINYKVHNSSTKRIKMPLAKIKLLGKNNNILKSRINDHTNIHIPPNQFIQVKTEFNLPPKLVSNVDVILGNKLDFLLY